MGITNPSLLTFAAWAALLLSAVAPATASANASAAPANASDSHHHSASTFHPKTRWGAVAGFLPTHNAIVFSGGKIDSHGTLTNETLLLDMSPLEDLEQAAVNLKSPTWLKVNSSSVNHTYPGLQYAASTVSTKVCNGASDDSFWVIGGSTSDCSEQEVPMWRYNLQRHMNNTFSGQWTPVFTGNQSQPRRSHGRAIIPAHGLQRNRAAAMVVLGGHDEAQYCGTSTKAQEQQHDMTMDVWTLPSPFHDECTTNSNLSKAIKHMDRNASTISLTMRGALKTVPAEDFAAVPLPIWPQKDSKTPPSEPLVFIGGRDKRGELADMALPWVLDLAEGQWKRWLTVGDIPEPRVGHSVVHLKNGTLLMYGGYKADNHSTRKVEQFPTDEMYALDSTSHPGVWRRVQYNSPPENGIEPSARAYHSALLVDDVLVVAFGQQSRGMGFLQVSHEKRSSMQMSQVVFMETRDTAMGFRWTDNLGSIVAARLADEVLHPEHIFDKSKDLYGAIELNQGSKPQPGQQTKNPDGSSVIHYGTANPKTGETETTGPMVSNAGGSGKNSNGQDGVQSGAGQQGDNKGDGNGQKGGAKGDDKDGQKGGAKGDDKDGQKGDGKDGQKGGAKGDGKNGQKNAQQDAQKGGQDNKSDKGGKDGKGDNGDQGKGGNGDQGKDGNGDQGKGSGDKDGQKGASQGSQKASQAGGQGGQGGDQGKAAGAPGAVGSADPKSGSGSGSNGSSHSKSTSASPSDKSAQSDNDDDNQSSTSQKGAIAGGVIGGAALAVGAVAGGLYAFKKRRDSAKIAQLRSNGVYMPYDRPDDPEQANAPPVSSLWLQQPGEAYGTGRATPVYNPSMNGSASSLQGNAGSPFAGGRPLDEVYPRGNVQGPRAAHVPPSLAAGAGAGALGAGGAAAAAAPWHRQDMGYDDAAPSAENGSSGSHYSYPYLSGMHRSTPSNYSSNEGLDHDAATEESSSVESHPDTASSYNHSFDSKEAVTHDEHVSSAHAAPAAGARLPKLQADTSIPEDGVWQSPQRMTSFNFPETQSVQRPISYPYLGRESAQGNRSSDNKNGSIRSQRSQLRVTN